MYIDLKVCITFEEEVAEISQPVGVRQGDNLSPVLFLIFMSAFSKSFGTKWRQSRINTSQFMRVLADDIANRKGQLTCHTLKTNTNNHYGIGSTFDILHILYLDDGTFIFICREDMIQGAK